jgi:hypothetical protein
MLSKYMRLFTQSGSYPDGDDSNPPDALTDVSLENQDGRGFLVDFDYLYIAQHYPFVNLFMLMEVFNAPLTVVPVIAIATPYNPVGPVDEVQSITFPTVPTSGTFTLTYDGETTSSLPFNATAQAVEDALRLLTGLATVDVISNATGYLVSFTGISAPELLTITPTALVTSVTSKPKFEYWDGTSWIDAVDVLDSSRGFYQHGMAQYSLKNDYSICEITETDSDSTGIPRQLVGLGINNCYWVRMSFVTTGIYDVPNPLTKIKQICYAFTITSYVNGVDVEGPTFYEPISDMTGESNKSDWVREIIHASEEMILDLKRVGFIKSSGQVIEFDELYLACTYKTLMHIYYQLGKAYAEKRSIMSNKYEKALSSKALTFDSDKDGKLDRNEYQATSTRMSR